jgi:hypothetical protein
MQIDDAALARRLLEAAVAMTTKPALSAAQVDDLMVVAASLDADLNTVYVDTGLNRAASLGWAWKAGLTSDQYDLGGGPGKTLTRSQWFDHCTQMSRSYASGTLGVLGGRRSGGIGVISLVTPGYTDGAL